MNTYYKSTLYPLQDKVLNIIKKIGTDFYLTGGTALSRCFFEYRYSDDLDFFLNSDPGFKEKVFKVIRELKSRGFDLKIQSQGDSYYSIFLDNILKVDFVNDVSSHIGEFIETDIFPRVDNVENILSNKITALIGRDEPKDVVDIWVINKGTKIDWKGIFMDANSKAVGILPPEVAQKLETFPLELLDKIQWVEYKRPETKLFENDRKEIVNAILMI